MTANKDLPQRGTNVDFTNVDFKIRHVSARVLRCEAGEYMPAREVYLVNVIAEAPAGSSSEDAFIHYAKDHIKLHVAESIEKIDEYYDKARGSLYHPKLEEAGIAELEGKAAAVRKSLIGEYFTEGYDVNPLKVLDYIKKFNVFQYCQYVEKLPVTTAAIETLQLMADTGEGLSKSSAAYYEFINLIQTLDLFWD
jgi:hypothetical protein